MPQRESSRTALTTIITPSDGEDGHESARMVTNNFLHSCPCVLIRGSLSCLSSASVRIERFRWLILHFPRWLISGVARLHRARHMHQSGSDEQEQAAQEDGGAQQALGEGFEPKIQAGQIGRVGRGGGAGERVAE